MSFTTLHRRPEPAGLTGRLLHRKPPPGRLLILRDGQSDKRGYNDHFRWWLDQYAPQLATLFDWRFIDNRGLRPGTYRLLIPWLQDPLYERDPALYRQALAIQKRFLQADVPVINPVESLSHGIKSRGLPLIGATGIRVARHMPVTTDSDLETAAQQLGFPFLLREDRLQSSDPILVECNRDVACLPWREMTAPLAMEFIDTRGADGLYRKYRCMCVGDTVLPRHLLISQDPIVRVRVSASGAAVRREESAYISAAEPHAATLYKARRALALDTVAFDYGIDRDGRLVVWEPNPFPEIWVENYQIYRAQFAYLLAPTFRIYAALLRYYLTRAGMADQFPTQLTSGLPQRQSE